jgi:cytochrome bd-type quinol oxidase subunit 1
MSLLELSRWQFALTVLFHMTFPAITVGLSIFLCIVYGLHDFIEHLTIHTLREFRHSAPGTASLDAVR